MFFDDTEGISAWIKACLQLGFSSSQQKWQVACELILVHGRDGIGQKAAKKDDSVTLRKILDRDYNQREHRSKHKGSKKNTEP